MPGDKVEVVYNAVEMQRHEQPQRQPAARAIGRDEKIVLFLGRVTMQKGPEYFLAAAKKVLEVMPNVRFVMAGSGDMIRRTIEMAAEHGHRAQGAVHRLPARRRRGEGLQDGRPVRHAVGVASRSASRRWRPFSHDVPVIISKQSGVCEVLTHVLKVDFWDVDEMANKIIAVLRHPPLRETLKQHSSLELRKLSWLDSARQCVKVYEEASCQHAAVH